MRSPTIVRHARALAGAVAFLVPAVASAGGFELLEQSPVGVATAGAQTAVADDPAAVFYNPAGLTQQPGFGAVLGGNLAHVDSEASVAGSSARPTTTAPAPTLYASQRLGKRLAVGLGAFSNFAEHFSYPADWAGRLQGTFVDITTATINPALAWQVFSRLSLGVGFDLVPAAIQLRRGLSFGGGEGEARVTADALGYGANAGLLVTLVPRYLRFGFTYRSRVDLDFSGHGAIYAPAELAQASGGLQTARTKLVLPHNMTFALSSRPIHPLTLSVDVHYTLWSDLSALTLTLGEAGAPGATQQTVALGLRNSVGVRAGAELRLFDDRARVRIGAGYDVTPVPLDRLSPLLPDTDRVLVSAGLGYRHNWFAVDAAYLAAILVRRTSMSLDLPASYSTVGHVISLALTLRFSRLGGRWAS
jgi:long-chain fatty acid transport protein